MGRLFDMLDVNKTGHINFRSFLSFVHVIRHGSKSQRMKTCFRFFDEDEDDLVNLEDLKYGTERITLMIQGATSTNSKILSDENYHVGEEDESSVTCRTIAESAKELMHATPSHICEKVYDKGPFGMRISTLPEEEYPVVLKILSEAASKRSIETGWRLLRINNVSLKDSTQEFMLETLKGVKFPATLTFHAVNYHHCAICDRRLANTLNSEETYVCGRACKKAVAQIKRAKKIEDYLFPRKVFAKVIHLHEKTAMLFRLLDDSSPEDIKTHRQSQVTRPKQFLEKESERKIQTWAGSGPKTRGPDPQDRRLSKDKAKKFKAAFKKGSRSVANFFGGLVRRRSDADTAKS